MIAWFEALPLLEQVFFYIAIPATVILLVQLVMLFIGGFGGGSGDMALDSDTSGLGGGAADFDGGSGLDADAASISDVHAHDGALDTYGLRFITLRGIVAFLTVTGWTGVCFAEFELPPWLSILLSVGLGALALIAIAYLVRALMRLQESGNADYRAALGQIGSVYIPIPAAKSGTGKITLTLSGFTEVDAVTNEPVALKTGQVVRVVDIIRDNVMVV